MARRGYFAPKHEMDAAQEAKREIEETLFSRDEWHDIPVELHTQFFKSSEVAAKLSVVTRIDVRQLRFKKADGRNTDVLTVVAGRVRPQRELYQCARKDRGYASEGFHAGKPD